MNQPKFHCASASNCDPYISSCSGAHESTVQCMSNNEAHNTKDLEARLTYCWSLLVYERYRSASRVVALFSITMQQNNSKLKQYCGFDCSFFGSYSMRTMWRLSRDSLNSLEIHTLLHIQKHTKICLAMDSTLWRTWKRANQRGSILFDRFRFVNIAAVRQCHPL